MCLVTDGRESVTHIENLNVFIILKAILRMCKRSKTEFIREIKKKLKILESIH